MVKASALLLNMHADVIYEGEDDGKFAPRGSDRSCTMSYSTVVLSFIFGQTWIGSASEYIHVVTSKWRYINSLDRD